MNLIHTNYNYSCYKPAFNGEYLGKVDIKAKNNAGEVVPKKVSAVKLDMNYLPDLEAVEQATKKWDKDKNSGYYAADIQECARKDYKALHHKSETNHIFYMLTLQTRNFERIKPDKILGIAVIEKMEDEERDELKWLQGNPEYTYFAKAPRQYSGIGKSLVQFIRNYGGKPLDVTIYPKTLDFYKNCGFKHPDKNDLTHLVLD